MQARRRGAVGSGGPGPGAVAAAACAVAVAALLFVLRPLSLVLPAGGLDSSWMAVLGEAATRPARWGVDLAFTYGPASALVTRYFTDGYLAAAVPFAVAVALLNGVAFAAVAALAVAGRRRRAALVVAAAAVEVAALGSQIALDQDSFYFCLAFVVLLLDGLRRPGARAPLAVVVVGAALLGATAMAKTSYGVAALLSLAVADARALLAWRRPPLLVPVALLGSLAAFLALGQHLGDLAAYLRLQGEEASGYGEAMYLSPNRAEIAAYLCGALALVLAAAATGLPGRGGRLAAALGTAALMLLGLKAGFVRADSHTQIAWSLLGLVGVAAAAGLVLPRSLPGAASLAAASLAVLWGVGPLFLLAATDSAQTPANLVGVYRDMGAELPGQATDWARFLRSPAAFAAAARAAKAGAWASIRAAQPLPPLPGGVDVLPSEQAMVLANGLDYRPRPSFQEYSTYAPGLIAANAAFLRGPDAPEWIVFGAGGLDDRDPSFTEGALWPELLRRYEPQRRTGPWLILRRRAEPLAEVLGPARRIDGTLGRKIDLPADAGPLFARVTVRRTALGDLAAAVFRPPALSLRLDFAGGDGASYRFIPAIAREGFMLSPSAGGTDEFADLAFGRGGAAGGPPVVGLTVGGSRWADLFYAPDVSLELSAVSVPAATPSPGARALADELARALSWRRFVGSFDRDRRLGDDRLSAPAPTALTVPVEGARRLSLDFGIDDGAWQDGDTRGVCFAVSAPANGSAPLWRRCLDPKAVPADRGPQKAEVDLPPGLRAVTAETTCPASCDWSWSYWGAILPEGG